ncbi:MAG: acyl-CoA thioesterase/BAAT N-terminal domain-containing protein [Oceanicaulis sp.]
MVRFTIVGAVALIMSSAALAESNLQLIAPDSVMRGDPVSIRVDGLAPGETVEIIVERAALGREPGLMRSRAVFQADDEGRLDTARSPAVGGAYEGVDETGLFRSLTRVADAPAPDLRPGEFLISALAGEHQAATRMTLLDASSNVSATAIHDLPGAALYRIEDGQSRPLIIVLGGSEGGLFHALEIAPALASRGYAALALPYYAPAWVGPDAFPGLPDSFVNIPVELLELARDAAAALPGVDADRVGVWGASKGAEFALLGCSKFPWITATAAMMASDVVWEGWGPAAQGPGQSASFAWRGEALEFVPYEGADAYFGAFERGEWPTVTLASVHASGRSAHPERAERARIRVEACEGEVLAVGGGADLIWPSGEMAAQVAQNRAEAGRQTITLIDEAAGHGLAGPGFVPTGDDPAANGPMQTAGWRAALAMFERQLKGAPTP